MIYISLILVVFISNFYFVYKLGKAIIELEDRIISLEQQRHTVTSLKLSDSDRILKTIFKDDISKITRKKSLRNLKTSKLTRIK